MDQTNSTIHSQGVVSRCERRKNLFFWNVGEVDLCPTKVLTVSFKLVVQGLREIGVSYCVHNVTTAVLPSKVPLYIMYTIGHMHLYP